MFSYDQKSKVLAGIELPPFYHPNLSFGHIALHYLQRDPSRVIQANYDDGVELTAGEMVKLSLRIAKNIDKEGLRVGDVVGMAVKNTTYVTPAVLACFLVGCPISTMDPTFDVNEIANIFKQTKPKMVFCDHDNHETVIAALKRCENEAPAITIDQKIRDVRCVMEFLEIQQGEREYMPPHFGIEATRLCSAILCSSGTTGLSKGVMLSSAQCVAMTLPFRQFVNPSLLCFSSLYWLSGFTTLVASLVNLSKRVITKRKFSPLTLIHLVEQYKVNIVLGPPSQAAMIVQSPAFNLADFSSVRAWIIAGGYMTQHFRETLQDHLLYGALLVTYGLTEVGAVVASTVPFQKASNSVGKITPNFKMKIIDDDGNILGPHEIGEIHVLGALRFLGYASNPEATRNAFDNVGWLKTGDLGYITEDGEIFIVDRKKEMIKYLSYQVAPSELETCILKMEGVKAVSVVGITDMIVGELAAAVVVKEQNSFLNEQDIVDEIARNFAQFKRLHGGVYFVQALPLTPSGKVKKAVIRKIATQLFKSQEINGNY